MHAGASFLDRLGRQDLGHVSVTYPVTVPRCHDLIRKLEAEIESLKDRILAAECEREDLARQAMDEARKKYGLTEIEAAMLGSLAADRITRTESLQAKFGYKSAGDVSLRMRRLIKKMSAFSVQVVAVPGIGWKLAGTDQT
jgi:hypothetical protein